MRVLALTFFALACGSSGTAATAGAPLLDGGSDAGAPGFGTPTAIPGLTIDPSISARVVVGGLGTLDDIAVAPDGTVYIGSESRGRLSAWSPASGNVTLITSTLAHPEGIVTLGGALVVCEQGKNQLSRVDPSDGSVTLFRALSNGTGRLGVDGLALDPLNPSIIVPDSPNGTLLRVSLDGRTATPILVASARKPPFTRPTGAFARSDGTLFIADEGAGEVVERKSDGSLEVLLAGLNLPDDVVVDDQGDVYVNTVGDGVLHRLHGSTHQVLIRGLTSPHGLALELDGNVLVTDVGGGGRLIEVSAR